MNDPRQTAAALPGAIDWQAGVKGFQSDNGPQLAALNRTNINVQELIVEAALTGSKEASLPCRQPGPADRSGITLPQIRSMVDEMLQAETQWLPEFEL